MFFFNHYGCRHISTSVIPAKAGNQLCERVIPAFAGMTGNGEYWIFVCAGMTFKEKYDHYAPHFLVSNVL